MSTTTDILPPRYLNVELVGRGAMGDIYRATDEALSRTVAVKVLAERYAEDAAIRIRFEREARTAARLSSTANVVGVFDVGTWLGRPYLVMEYLEGGSLADRLATGRPPLGLALQWLEQTARALDAAHAAGVVHRDVKPANILLDGGRNVRVADFGIARAVGQDSLTTAGTILGTAGYLSPEQARGEPATAASDRYSLGVVAFELLTGTRPFERDSATAEAFAHMHAPVPPPHRLRPELPPGLEAVFARALAKDPNDRFASCRELAWAIRDAIVGATADTAVLPRTPPTTQTHSQTITRRRRFRPAIVPLALVAVGLGGLAAGLLLSASSKRVQTRVQTLTVQGKVVQHTVTVSTPPAAAPPPPTTPPPSPSLLPSPPPPVSPPATGDAHSLNDRGYSLMKQSDWAAALPLLQAAVRGLAGAGPSDPYEAYANYNLGYTLVKLGQCSAAIQYLRHADRLEPGNHDVHAALSQASHC